MIRRLGIKMQLHNPVSHAQGEEPYDDVIVFKAEHFDEAALEIYRAGLLANSIGNSFENFWPHLRDLLIGEKQ